MVCLWPTKEINIKMASSVTITSAAALDTFFSAGTEVQAAIKDFRITEPASEVEKIDLMGEDANGFQNACMEQKPFSLAEVQLTGVLKGDEVIEAFIYPTGAAINSTHTRYQPGKGTRPQPSVLFNLDDGTDEVNIVMDNCWVTASEVGVTGADGHVERTFTFKCLASDFYMEFKD